MYGLLVFLTALSLYFFVKLTQRFSYETLVFYVLSTIALLLTHPYSIFIIVAQNAYILSTYLYTPLELRSSVSLPQWFSIQAVTGIIALPGLFRMLELAVAISTGSTEGWVHWITSPNAYILIETLLTYSGYPDFYPYLAESSVVRWIAYLVLAISIVCFAVAFGEYHSWKDERKSTTNRVDGFYLLLLVLLSVTLLPYIISKMFTPIYVIQSTVLGTVPFYLIIAFGISRISRKHVKTSIIAFLIVGLALSGGVYLSTGSEEPFDDVVTNIESDPTTNDLVVLHPNFIENSYYYYQEEFDYETVAYTLEFREEEEGDLRARSDTHDQIWLVSRESWVSEPVIDTLESSHELQSHDQYGNLHVYRFTRPGDGREREQRHVQ